ncbi:MAG: DUF4215 domain-containing protein, partial [Deltaproteobacteria bacterium]|nr:DUF4215 domain-containing protein [Deltaproteobacteria bacterium]
VNSTQTTDDSKTTTISFTASMIEYDDSVSEDILADISVDILPDLDLDDDGYSNFDELDQGSDPNDASDLPIICGNSIEDTGEACDDGNTTAGDGCSETCQVETAAPVCGNGTAESGEDCDDGNTVSGDGCSSGCKSESVTITVNNLTDGETVQDTESISADASSNTADIKRLIITSPVLTDTNILPDVFDTTWDTTDTSNYPEDQSTTLTFYAEDKEGNRAYKTVSVLVDNTPNIASFGTSALIQNGGSASLTWEANNYTSLSVDNSVGTLSASSGATSVTPSTTTTYTLTATRTGTSSTFTATGSVTIQVNYNPSFDGSTTTEFGQDPASGITVSWSQSDSTDGLDDTVTAEVRLYEGTGCSGDYTSYPSSTSTVSIDPDTLNPRTDYSYTVALSDSNGGTASTSDCQTFTTSDTGLVGWWRFDEGSGTTAEDSSGYGGDGTLQGDIGSTSGWTSGVSSGALQFNGTNDLVAVSQASGRPDFHTSALTLEAWVNPSSLMTGDDHYVISQYLDGDPSDASFRLQVRGTDPQVAVFDTGSDYITSSEAAEDLSVDTWVHLVGVWDGGGGGESLRVYVNGDLVQVGGSEVGDFTAMWDSSEPLRIGAGKNSTDGLKSFFNGIIDEVAVYDRALSTQEIRDFCQDGETAAGISCAADDVPAQLTPSNGLELPPTRAFLSWEVGSLDSTKIFSHYDLCVSTSNLDSLDCAKGAFVEIDDSSQTYYVIESLSSSSTYYWEMRTCYGDGGTDCSAYSPVWSFSTDSSLVGWWRMDELVGIETYYVLDSSGHEHPGGLEGTPSLGSDGDQTFLTFDGNGDYLHIGEYTAFDMDTAV